MDRQLLGKCVVEGCNPPLGTTTHQFPIRPMIAEKWRAAINSPKLANLPLSKLRGRYVCCRHFRRDDYTSSKKMCRLLWHSVPSRHLRKKSASPSIEDTKDATDTDDDESDVGHGGGGNKVDPQEHLMAMEKAVAELIDSGLLGTDEECLNSLSKQHAGRSREMEEERRQLLAKVSLLEEKLKNAQETLKCYKLCLEETNSMIEKKKLLLEDANSLVNSSILGKWNMLNDEQKQFLEMQLNEMIPDKSEIEIVFEI